MIMQLARQVSQACRLLRTESLALRPCGLHAPQSCDAGCIVISGNPQGLVTRSVQRAPTYHQAETLSGKYCKVKSLTLSFSKSCVSISAKFSFNFCSRELD